MLCPKCHIEMKNGCCLKCGYLVNGNQIEEKQNIDKFADLKLYSKKFDTFNQNSNWIWPVLIGPLYLSYRGYLFLGTLFGIIHFAIVYLIQYKLSNIYFSFVPLYACIFYEMVIRILYGTCLNEISLKLDEIKINRIKKKYPKAYRKKLLKHQNHVSYIFLSILIYVVIVLVIMG